VAKSKDQKSGEASSSLKTSRKPSKKRYNLRISEAVMTRALNLLASNPDYTTRRLANELDVPESALAKRLQALRKEAEKRAAKSVEDRIKLLTREALDEHEKHARLLNADIDALQRQIDDVNMAGDTRKKLRDQRNDLIWRLDTHRNALGKTLKPLGITAEGGASSAQNSPSVNILQIFYQKDPTELSGKALDAFIAERFGEVGKYLEERKLLDTGEIECDVEVLDD